MTAYYNEIDPYAAQWLRNLIAAGHIAPGVVDQRSITEVTPDDLKGFTQVHFFAGIGVWSYALRRAGWPDSRPVWTGSCPCQPFSAAGRRRGKSDDRHLWPVMFDLIRKCRPGVVFGEQVASADGLAWLDDVQNDLESAEYAAAAVDLCAAGVGAPHIRQRLYWLADANGQRVYGGLGAGAPGGIKPANCGEYNGLADASDAGSQGGLPGRTDAQRQTINGHARRSGPADGMADPHDVQRNKGDSYAGGCGTRGRAEELEQHATAGRALDDQPGPVNGFWADAIWLPCRDGKHRPVKPGIVPLVDGATARVGRIRAYGNALVAPVAEIFITAYMEASNDEQY